MNDPAVTLLVVGLVAAVVTSLVLSLRLGALRRECDALAHQTAQNAFEQWKDAHEERIRQDAIDRSRAVIAGQVTEHLVPYLPGFRFNPKDARFIGSPVDIVVFDGLDEGAEDVSVVFLEIKTGGATLSGRERRIREAIRAGRVGWEEIRGAAPKASVAPARTLARRSGR